MSDTSASHEPYAGKDLGEIAFVCTPTMLEHYCEGLAVDPARYAGPSYFDKAAAPAMIVGEVDGGKSFPTGVGHVVGVCLHHVVA